MEADFLWFESKVGMLPADSIIMIPYRQSASQIPPLIIYSIQYVGV